MPGPGGSLGQCAICGKPFISEILLGQTVPSFKVTGCNQELFAHCKCLPKDGNLEPSSLPETSPLRKAWEDARKEMEGV